jgi:hypothetical protein
MKPLFDNKHYFSVSKNPIQEITHIINSLDYSSLGVGSRRKCTTRHVVPAHLLVDTSFTSSRLRG